ncbi:hypothetical protein FZEAL_9058 [Fusarium zealandicum]|uniref:Fatty acid desaturase domain-containing protein n=1 Tax=Fusarium zealandicum TaxID=1053134 RepID=A0A8H4UCP5_9HYPO|nr:hypothetical protein FZEAL_9058 [Fusarium zealandicum]
MTDIDTVLIAHVYAWNNTNLSTRGTAHVICNSRENTTPFKETGCDISILSVHHHPRFLDIAAFSDTGADDMDRFIVDGLTKPDSLILQCLAADIDSTHSGDKSPDKGARDEHVSTDEGVVGRESAPQDGAEAAVKLISALNDPKSSDFEPTVFNGTDFNKINAPQLVDAWILRPFIAFARSVVRVETDVVMVVHLVLYFTTSVPSAAFLFWRFSWIHGILHSLMQFSYIGTYTLMMHQHIHQRGILSKRFAAFDLLFPYLTDPLMGHTWNSYFYHHVKHHHVEGNGPNDLSSTLRYQRDNVWHFLHYVGRFLLFILIELPLYFIRKGKPLFAFKVVLWEGAYYSSLALLLRANPKPTTFVFLLPFFFIRAGLMVGNWGQHAFIDHDDPDSDYRSSITLIDVASNRHCFNDGYHTSHHLNPLRHWREHPVSFLKTKDLYASQSALVFYDIDYLMITFRLLMKDYRLLARHMVPMGSQVSMSLEQLEALLESHARQFTDEEIKEKFGKTK